MNAATLAKAARLAHHGQVAWRGMASVYEVEGEHGTYRVVIGDDFRSCTCPAHGDCSHVGAAMLAHDARGNANEPRSTADVTRHTTALRRIAGENSGHWGWIARDALDPIGAARRAARKAAIA